MARGDGQDRGHCGDCGDCGPEGAQDRQQAQPAACTPQDTPAPPVVRRRRTARHQLEQAELLAATLAQVGAAPDLEAALKALVRGALLLLRGDHAMTRLFERESPERHVAVYVEAYGDGRQEVRWQPRGHLQPDTYGAALRDGGPAVLVDDFWGLDPARYTAYLKMRQQGLRASVNVPIDSGGRRIGSLHVDHHQPGFFDDVDLATAEALAAQAGAAIDRARAIEAQQEARRQLDAQDAELAARSAEAAALRDLDRLKNEFIRSISHELRTPLTTLHGYAQQLHTRAHALEPAMVERIAGTMLASSTRLTRLVTDLLDFARIERGELVFRPEAVDLAPALRRAAADAADRPSGERVECHAPDGLIARADSQKITQAVANLLDNALKYAPHGTITLRAHRVPGRGEMPPVVRIEVEDQGPGIPRREQARVWEKFYRGSAVAGLNLVPGGGVGLAVVKALVEAQGGRTGLDTPDQGGCRFWIELPAAHPAMRTHSA